MNKLSPETIDEIEIATWLSKYGYEIATNRIHPFHVRIFRIKGSKRGKPDMLAKTPKTKEWYAVEIKTTDQTQNILSSTKILRYFKSYIKKETAYYLDGKEIKIKGFLVATKFSQYSHLFREETFEENEKWPLLPNLLPKKEGVKTKLFLRQLWETYKQCRTLEQLEAKEDTSSIGILSSTYSENKLDSPLFQVMGTYFHFKNAKWQYGQKLIKE